MRWLRLYAEMLNDPKIGTLSDAEFRTWIEVLCLACEADKDGDTGLNIEEIAWKTRRCNVTETFQTLFDRNLLVSQNGKNGVKTVSVMHWKKRQFKSDRVSERVDKYREKQKILKCNVTETLQKQKCNVLDTDTDTDKERDKSLSSCRRSLEFQIESPEFQLSEFLFDEIRKRNPNHKQPNLQAWAKDIDLMIRVDNRSPEDIRAVIAWVQQDPFWQCNILSTKKLREKFDALKIKMEAQKHGNNGGNGNGNGKLRVVDAGAGASYVKTGAGGRCLGDGNPYPIDLVVTE